MNTSTTTSKLIAVTLVVTGMYLLQSIIVPLLFAILLAILLCPLTVWLEKRGIPSALAAALTVVMAFLGLGGLLWFIVDQVIAIGSGDFEFSFQYAEVISSVENFFIRRFDLQPTELWEWIKNQSQDFVNNATRYISLFFGSAGSTLANFVLIPLYIFFMLYYRSFFIAFLYKAFPRVAEEKMTLTLHRIYYVIQSYILGLFTVMGIVAILNTVGLLVMGIANAWFFGILAALLLLIPYIGIAIGSLLPAVFALATKDSAWYALGVLIWFQIVQFFEGNFITPNIVGGKVSVNPMFAILSLLLGGMLFGLPGLILAMPMVAVLKVVFDASESWQAFGFVIGEPDQHYLRKKVKKRVRKRWKLPDLYKNRNQD